MKNTISKVTMQCFIIFSLVCFFESLASEPDVEEYLDVKTELGTYRGRSDVSESGVKFFVFRGMHYALPVLYRFDESKPLNVSWNEIKTAYDYKPDCIGLDNFVYEETSTGERIYKVYGEEHCLYINVHTRSITTKKPVIFFIHGDAFSYGGPKLFDAQYIMEKDVVFVNFGYRLGPLGFLSTGDKIIPGNMGLKDQLLALQWVQRHIDAFGGDRNKISLSGMGAGGVSVHFMYLSPLTRGLFKSGYSYSGSALCPWAIMTDIPQKTKQLAGFLNCTLTPTAAMVNCLRRTDVDKLLQATDRFKVFFFNPFTIFGPVVDSYAKVPYLPAEPELLLSSGNFQDLPWISGFTAENGLHPGAEFLYNKNRMRILLYKWKEYLPYILFYKRDCPADVALKLKKALFLYKKAKKLSFASAFLQMMTDRLYIIPALRSAAYMAKRNKASVYLYYFLYRGIFTIAEHLRRETEKDDVTVFHGDDVAYVYYLNSVEMRYGIRDGEMSKEMVNLAATFANTSAPPASFNVWKPATGNTMMFNYLEISGPMEYSSFTEGNNFMSILEEFLSLCHY